MAEEVKVPNRWIFVIAGFIINLCLGTIYAWSVFRPGLQAAPYSLTSADSLLPFSIFLLVFGISFAFAGRMVGKVGPKQPILIGGVLLGVGYVLSYSIVMAPASALMICIVTFGLIAGCGCGYAYNPPIAVTNRWFPDKRGLATGLNVMGFGLSSLITAPLVTSLIASQGMANTFLILGVVFLVLIIALGSLMKFPPAEWKAPPVPAATAKKAWVAASVDFDTSQMTKTTTFFIVWIIFMIGAGAGLMVIGYARQIAEVIGGLVGPAAVLAVQVMGIGNAIGRPIMGTVCDKIGPKNTLYILFAVQLICLVALFPYSTGALVYITIPLFAFMFGAYLAVVPTVVSYFFGAKNVGPNYGLYLSAYGVGGVVMPMLMAYVVGPKPTAATYVQGFYVTAVFCVIGLILTFIMKPPPKPT